MINQHLKKYSDKITRAILPRWNLNPTGLTMVSIFFKILTLATLLNGMIIEGIIFFLLDGTFDLLDGFYARINKRVDKLGGFLDHCSDAFFRPLYIFALAFAGYLTFALAALTMFFYTFHWLMDSIAKFYKLKTKKIPNFTGVILFAGLIFIFYLPYFMWAIIIINSILILTRLVILIKLNRN
jgi:hypothetical protein